MGLGAERGVGLLRALELNADIGAKVVAYARDQLAGAHGAGAPGWANTALLLNSPRPAVLRFMPALNLTTADIDLMVDGLRRSIVAVRAAG